MKELRRNWSSLGLLLVISGLLLMNQATTVVEGQSYPEYLDGLHVSYLIRTQSLIPAENSVEIPASYEFISFSDRDVFYVSYNMSWDGTWTYTYRRMYIVEIDILGRPCVFVDTSGKTINDEVGQYTIKEMIIQDWHGSSYGCYRLERDHTGMLGVYNTTAFYHAELGLLIGLYTTFGRLNDSAVVSEVEVTMIDSNFDEFQTPLTTTTASTTEDTSDQPSMESLLGIGIFTEIIIIIIIVRWSSKRDV